MRRGIKASVIIDMIDTAVNVFKKTNASTTNLLRILSYQLQAEKRGFSVEFDRFLHEKTDSAKLIRQ